MAGGWWERRVVPHIVDLSLGGEEVLKLRRVACADLGGRVLELGFGSGLNLRALPDAVTRLDAVEPSDQAWDMSAKRRQGARPPVHRVGLDGQRLAAEDATYDAVLCTFTLCTIPDPALALTEVRRVLRPGGRFAFLEHGLAPTPGMARWQRRLNGVQRRLAGGCHLDRDVPALVRAAGLDVTTLRSEYLFGRSPWTYGYLGSATA